jgi:hypothetical protein
MGMWSKCWLATCGVVAALILSLQPGCEGKHRESSVGALRGERGMAGTMGSSGVGPGLTVVNGQLTPLGLPCDEGQSCASGYCADGVCCDGACTELCASCAVPGSEGTCSPVPSDTACDVIACPGSTECRGRDQSGLTLNCEGIGKCRSALTCAALDQPGGTPCQEGAGQCDGNGACVVPGKVALGGACGADGECAEGHCVASGQDGTRVCCDAACDGVCQACSAGGRCEVTPETDARCGPVACPLDNVCRNYVPAITENLCRSFGQCRDALDCATPDFFTSLRPSVQCVCDPASGDCALAVGTSCTQNGDCASGACMKTAQGNQVCCSGPCAADLVCSSAGTACVQCEGAQITCNGNVQQTCNAGTVVTTNCVNGCTPGVGCNALPPVGFLCDAGQCASGALCQQDIGGQARCCVRDCTAEGKVCAASGSCECPPGQVAAANGCLLQPGDPCQSGSQCQAGLTCVDGVCCTEACNGYCERCQSNTGECSAIPAGQQEADAVSGNNCTNGFECTGVRNGCRARTGQACSNADGSDCVSGNCVPTAGGGARVCCSQPCGGTLAFCSSTGQSCVQCESAAQCGNGCDLAQGTCNPLKNAGETCSVDGQCSTNRCVPAADGSNLSRCCANCATGQLCTAQGQCVNAQSELGGNCSTTANCRVGVCSSGICCGSACDPLCEVCGANGACQSNGACDAFDCIAPNPPAVTANLPAGNNIFLLGTPPAARGGTVRDGRYTPARIDFSDVTGVTYIPTYEFRGRSVQIAEQDFVQFSPPLSFGPEFHYAGTFTTSGTSLTFNVEFCDIQFNGITLQTPTVQYTATPNGLIAISQQASGPVMISYVRQ